MALFERSTHAKATFDDTETLICNIENAQNINNHTEYTLRVQRGPGKENKWNIFRRYRDFAALNSALQQSNIDLPLPPKKLIGNMQPSFIAERQMALQNYINEVLKHQILALSLKVRTFLDPSNYSPAFADLALQTVSIALRGNGRYELKGPLTDMGWRIHKHYFLVTESDSKHDCILSWQRYGADRFLSDKDLQTAFKSLLNLSHPYIDKMLDIHNLETGAYVVRKIHGNGTVKDMLYGAEYPMSFMSKYGNPKVRKPFTGGQISHYGYQILQALKFLHEKGLVHGHLHPGNIAIHNQNIVLLDIENSLIGSSSVYRPHLKQSRRITTAEEVDVYCFGRTLYEMAYATSFEESFCDHYPEGIPNHLEMILRLCISSSAKKHGPVTIEFLLYHPFFLSAPLISLSCLKDEKIHLKFPLPLKEELKNAAECIEERLKQDQKTMRSAKQETRIQEILSSEVEMKKQKRKAKKRDSVWKSTSSLAETVRSQSASTGSSPTPPSLPVGTSVVTDSPPTNSSCVSRRSALLDDISAFDKNKLTKTKSNGVWKSTSSLAETVPSQNASTGSSPTPPTLPAGTSVAADSAPTSSSCVSRRSALLGDICAFDKNKLTKVSL